MFAAKSILFCLFLISLAVSQVFSSTRVNKTTPDGKVFITGDHNEVVVSTARETKIAVAEIKSKLQSLSKKDDELSQRITALEKEGKNRTREYNLFHGDRFSLVNICSIPAPFCFINEKLYNWVVNNLIRAHVGLAKRGSLEYLNSK